MPSNVPAPELPFNWTGKVGRCVSLNVLDFRRLAGSWTTKTMASPLHTKGKNVGEEADQSWWNVRF